jgi:hypothetical protein
MDLIILSNVDSPLNQLRILAINEGVRDSVLIHLLSKHPSTQGTNSKKSVLFLQMGINKVLLSIQYGINILHARGLYSSFAKSSPQEVGISSSKEAFTKKEKIKSIAIKIPKLIIIFFAIFFQNLMPNSKFTLPPEISNNFPSGFAETSRCPHFLSIGLNFSSLPEPIVPTP